MKEGLVRVSYDDGDVEWLDMRRQTWRYEGREEREKEERGEFLTDEMLVGWERFGDGGERGPGGADGTATATATAPSTANVTAPLSPPPPLPPWSSSPPSTAGFDAGFAGAAAFSDSDSDEGNGGGEDSRHAVNRRLPTSRPETGANEERVDEETAASERAASDRAATERSDTTALLNSLPPLCPSCSLPLSPPNLVPCSECSRPSHATCARYEATAVAVSLTGSARGAGEGFGSYRCNQCQTRGRTYLSDYAFTSLGSSALGGGPGGVDFFSGLTDPSAITLTKSLLQSVLQTPSVTAFSLPAAVYNSFGEDPGAIREGVDGEEERVEEEREEEERDARKEEREREASEAAQNVSSLASVSLSAVDLENTDRGGTLSDDELDNLTCIEAGATRRGCRVRVSRKADK